MVFRFRNDTQDVLRDPALVKTERGGFNMPEEASFRHLAMTRDDQSVAGNVQKAFVDPRLDDSAGYRTDGKHVALVEKVYTVGLLARSPSEPRAVINTV